MNEPPLMPALVCQRCGATNPPHAVKCWLCERGDHPNPYAAPMLTASTAAPRTPTLASSRVQQMFLALLIACAALALLIGVGIGVQDPGMLIPYIIVVAPAFLATGLRAALMVARKEQPRPSTLFFTFLWSGLFTALILILMIIAGIIALFLWCLQAMAGG